MGHAMARDCKKPKHLNQLSNFLDENVDSFGFYDQF